MNTDYLRFDSNSIKELITNKLNTDGTYSDQLFPGSDLTVLIETFCYMFDTMTYLENVGAAESIFTDSQYYENMNRIVKMLGYNPAGFITSFINCQLSILDGEVYNTTSESELILLPKYTTFTTSLNDTKGNPIKYTLIENFSTVVTTTSKILNDNEPIFYNGAWKLYPTTFVSAGIPFETFTLSSIDISLTNRQYISHDNIKVYVEETKNGITSWVEWYGDNNLYTATEKVFFDDNKVEQANNENRFFEYRLNENKQYTLTFGDNINGKQLPAESKVMVIYLESNGADGEIGPGVINIDGELSVEIEGLEEEFIKQNLLTDTGLVTWGSTPDEKLSLIRAANIEESYTSRDLETVDKIRERAPTSFRAGSRLITEQDFKQYVLAKFTNVFDICVMNNWTYMTEFQTWLNKYDKLKPDIKHYDYEFGDSCDFNNIYLWLKAPGVSKVSKSYKNAIERECDRLKPATSEIIPIDPFTTVFAPYLKGDYDLKNSWDTNSENKIIITRSTNTMVSVERIHQNAVQIILDFFKLENQSLGNTIDINNLYNQLMAIDGVEKVQTSYLQDGEPASKTEYYNGLSFAFWTPHIINGADFDKITGNYKILNFQFPVLLNPGNITNLINVTSDIYNISNIEF